MPVFLVFLHHDRLQRERQRLKEDGSKYESTSTIEQRILCTYYPFLCYVFPIFALLLQLNDDLMNIILRRPLMPYHS